MRENLKQFEMLTFLNKNFRSLFDFGSLFLDIFFYCQYYGNIKFGEHLDFSKLNLT